MPISFLRSYLRGISQNIFNTGAYGFIFSNVFAATAKYEPADAVQKKEK